MLSITRTKPQAPDSSFEEERTKTKLEETRTKELFHNLEPEQVEPTIEALASSFQLQKQELKSIDNEMIIL